MNQTSGRSWKFVYGAPIFRGRPVALSTSLCLARSGLTLIRLEWRRVRK